MGSWGLVLGGFCMWVLEGLVLGGVDACATYGAMCCLHRRACGRPLTYWEEDQGSIRQRRWSVLIPQPTVHL